MCMINSRLSRICNPKTSVVSGVKEDSEVYRYDISLKFSEFNYVIDDYALTVACAKC